MVKNKEILSYLDKSPNLKDILGRSTNKEKESLIAILIENCLKVNIKPEKYLEEIETTLQFGVDNLDANSNGEWKKKITEDRTGYNTTIAQFELGYFLKNKGLNVKIADDLEIVHNNEKINIEVKTFANINLWHECNKLFDDNQVGNVKILYEKVKIILDLEKFNNYNDKINWIYKDIIKKLSKEIKEENFNVEDFEYEGKNIFEKSRFASTDVITIDKELAKKQILNTLNKANSQFKEKFSGKRNIIYIDIKNSNVDLNQMRSIDDFYSILLGEKITLANKYLDGSKADDWCINQIKTNHIGIDKSAFSDFSKLYNLWFETKTVVAESTSYSYIKSKGLFFDENFKYTSAVLIRNKNDELKIFLNPFAENKITEDNAIELGFEKALIQLHSNHKFINSTLYEYCRRLYLADILRMKNHSYHFLP